MADARLKLRGDLRKKHLGNGEGGLDRGEETCRVRKAVGTWCNVSLGVMPCRRNMWKMILKYMAN